MSDDTTALRQEVIDACREMNARGLNHGSAGNISVRVGDRILITPSAIAYADLTPGMLVTVTLAEGAVSGGQKPSSEWRFHRDLMRSRDDIQVVVHAHPVHCVALAMNRQRIPACHYMIAAFGGNSVEMADYALFGTAALSDHVTAAMTGRYACLMANHGALCAGATLKEAIWRLEELEKLAQSYLLALSAGTPVILSEAEMKEAQDAFAAYKGQGRA